MKLDREVTSYLMQNLRMRGNLNIPIHLNEIRQWSNLTFTAEFDNVWSFEHPSTPP
jgi:hypothetical protein